MEYFFTGLNIISRSPSKIIRDTILISLFFVFTFLAGFPFFGILIVSSLLARDALQICIATVEKIYEISVLQCDEPEPQIAVLRHYFGAKTT